MTSLLTEARRLLKHIRKWTALEKMIERKTRELEECKKALQKAEHPKHVRKHSIRYSIAYKQLHALIALKKKISIDIKRIEEDLKKELAKIRAELHS